MKQIFIYKILKLKGDKPIFSANPEIAQEFTGKDYIITCRGYGITGLNIYKTSSFPKATIGDFGIPYIPTG